jgi:hypothetical protein
MGYLFDNSDLESRNAPVDLQIPKNKSYDFQIFSPIENAIQTEFFYRRGAQMWHDGTGIIPK